MMTPLKLRTLSCHLGPEAQKLSAVEFVALNSQYCPVYFLNGSISTACMLPFGIDSSIRNEVSFVKHLTGQHQRTSNQNQKHFCIS